MLIEFTHLRDDAYFADVFRIQARRLGRILMVPGWSVLLWGAVVAAVFHDEISAVAAGGTAAAVGAVIVYAAHRWGSRRPAPPPPSFRAPRRWSISDRGIVSSSDQSTVSFAWPMVRSMTESPRFFLFRMRRGVAIDVPREPLSADQEAMLRAFRTRRPAIGEIPAAGTVAGRMELTLDRPARQWVITDDFIAYSEAGSTHTWHWPIVHEVLVRPDLYLFKQEDGNPPRHLSAWVTGMRLPLPRVALTAEQDTELRALLTARGLLT